MDSIVSKISGDLKIPIATLEIAIRLAKTRCRKFSILKKNGDTRQIIQPSVKVKPILSWLSLNVLNSLPVHDAATAFRRGKSILDNTSKHKEADYSVRLDLKDFFPSIKPEDLWRVMLDSRHLIPEWSIKEDAFWLISNVCFDQNNQLPIGYSTSPAIANAVMHRIDTTLANAVMDDSRFGAATVTRYADDFVFSTNKRGACKNFSDLLHDVIKTTNSPSLQINENKTRYMSRAGGSTIITGLRVNNLGAVVVHGNYRDHVRLLLKLFDSGRLALDQVPQLAGHLAYIEHVDPALFTKLSFKHYKRIEEIRSLRLVE
ncbi:hypothetical protein FHT32_006987 [Variovorax sp. SG517]|uniref:retron St85 family RNA-directed DNA polymerase n=1 Tax=Variovorax sp. SG517 TaxID=2587117 RepID=UPI00159DFCCF|nr:retron St85 family RNA-directed DNA polymerase [Variovorax sp. SG517]NVM93290.1 hypothetical protein [Variovorax sp. SG517]